MFFVRPQANRRVHSTQHSDRDPVEMLLMAVGTLVLAAVLIGKVIAVGVLADQPRGDGSAGAFTPVLVNEGDISPADTGHAPIRDQNQDPEDDEAADDFEYRSSSSFARFAGLAEQSECERIITTRSRPRLHKRLFVSRDAG